MAAQEDSAKAQAFVHRLVQFADVAACHKFFTEKQIDFDTPNDAGWTVLMSAVASARADLVGDVLDRTTNVESVTIPNGTTVLHLAAMAPSPEVMEELTANDSRVAKLQAIANACNRNGDTPLMMACVVKNVAAVKVLLEKLGAFVSPSNASGMTALMCASRLRDPREGPTMAAESEAIVELLLVHEAEVNAKESAGDMTALHFALLTKNDGVIRQLIAIKGIDVTVRNKTGHSPLELAHKLKLDNLINEAVESRWQVIEDEAKQLSERVAEELAAAVAIPSTDAATKSKKKKKSAKKEKAKAVEKEPEPEASKLPQENAVLNVSKETETNSVLVNQSEQQDDDGNAEWVTAATKKSKRKDSIVKETKGSNAVKPKATGNSSKAKAKASKISAPAKVTPPAKLQVTTPPSTTPTPLKRDAKAPWGAQTVTTASSPVSDSTVSTTTAASPRSGQSLTYEQLNAAFHRMFPIAEEMDISVESFITGAAVASDDDFLSGLSVSQVEMLQEAHLQAYHYLNERKIELARVLEVERIEAQLELRRQILELP